MESPQELNDLRGVSGFVGEKPQWDRGSAAAAAAAAAAAGVSAEAGEGRVFSPTVNEHEHSVLKTDVLSFEVPNKKLSSS